MGARAPGAAGLARWGAPGAPALGFAAAWLYAFGDWPGLPPHDAWHWVAWAAPAAAIAATADGDDAPRAWRRAVRWAVAVAGAWAILSPRVPRALTPLEGAGLALLWGTAIAGAWTLYAERPPRGGSGSLVAAAVVASLVAATGMRDAGSGVLASVATCVAGAVLGSSLAWIGSVRAPTLAAASAFPCLLLGLELVAANAYARLPAVWICTILAILALPTVVSRPRSTR